MPEVETTKAKPTPTPKIEHRHPVSYRTPVYYGSCRACIIEDEKRSGADKPALYTEEEQQDITFLYPEDSYEGAVCQAYMAKRYPYAPFHNSQLSLLTMLQLPAGNKIVVLKRTGKPGKPMGKRYKRSQDEEKRWADQEIDPNEYIDQVVESAPLDIRGALITHEGDRFTRANIEHTEFLDQLADLCGTGFRIEVSRLSEVNGVRDSLIRMVRV